tara:strand:+ start:7828 stop:8718 length:891 start_codon:yes stop_codon:yes gene_type:complete
MFKGIFSTPPIPYVNKKIKLELYDNFLNWQKNQGIDNVYLLGTWGGHGLLNFNEKKSLINNFSKICNKVKLKQIVNVSSFKEKEIIYLSNLAENTGVEAVSILLPQYYSTAGYLKLSDYKRYVNRLLKEIKIPIYIYNNPRTMSVSLSPVEFSELSSEGISGIKDGTKDISWLIKTKNILKRKKLNSEIIPGNTQALIYGFLYGCSSVMTGASIVYPKTVRKIYDLIKQKKIKPAIDLHEKILNLRSMFGISPPATAQALISNRIYNLGNSHPLWTKIKKKELLKIKKMEKKFKLF